jgi:hypothetical protein
MGIPKLLELYIVERRAIHSWTKNMSRLISSEMDAHSAITPSGEERHTEESTQKCGMQQVHWTKLRYGKERRRRIHTYDARAIAIHSGEENKLFRDQACKGFICMHEPESSPWQPTVLPGSGTYIYILYMSRSMDSAHRDILGRTHAYTFFRKGCT